MATPHAQPPARVAKQQKLANNNKKMMKSNITNKMGSHRSDGCVSDEDIQAPEEEGDSSANDEQASSDDEPDVTALSGAGKLSAEAEQRLAGYTDDVMFIDEADMSDEMQATAGAEAPAQDDDDDYNGLPASDDGDSLADGDEASFMKDIENDLRQEYEQKFPETMEELLREQASESFDMFNQDPFSGFTPGTNEFQDMMNVAELSIWRMPDEVRGREDSMQSNPKQKKVRFEEGVCMSRSPSHSSSEGSDDANEQFPDIFMDSSDPAIQTLMARDTADLAQSAIFDGSDAGSVYDFDDDADRFAFATDERDSDVTDDDCSSESDDDSGEETEDESLSEKVRNMQELRKALGCKPVTSRPTTPTSGKKMPTPAKKAATPAKPVSSRSETTPRPVTPKSGSKGPKMGLFKLDPTKATLTADVTGKTVIQLPTRPAPKNKAFWERARTAINSRDNSPRSSISIARRGSLDLPPRPFTAQATLGTNFNGNFEFVHHNEMTPAPVMTPFIRPAAMQTSFTSSLDIDSDMEVEDVDLSQLVHLDGADSDAEDPVLFTSPMEPAFLTHGSVGSFRLNQNRAKQESSLSSNPAERRATAEGNALQSGRRAAGNTPITPARKKRISQDLSRTASGIRKIKGTAVASSPLAGRRRSRGHSVSGIDQTLSPGYSAWLR